MPFWPLVKAMNVMHDISESQPLLQFKTTCKRSIKSNCKLLWLVFHTQRLINGVDNEWLEQYCEKFDRMKTLLTLLNTPTKIYSQRHTKFTTVSLTLNNFITNVLYTSNFFNINKFEKQICNKTFSWKRSKLEISYSSRSV